MEGVAAGVLLAFRKNVEHFLGDGLGVEAEPPSVPLMLGTQMKGARNDGTFSRPLLCHPQNSEL